MKSIKKIFHHKKFVIFFAFLFVLSFVGTFVSCILLSPKIELENTKITLLVGEKFEEPKYRAFLMNKDVSDMVNVDGEVDSNKIGEYVLKYEVDYYLFVDKKNVVVSVVDKESPVIELVGGEDVNLCPNKEYEELGYKAIDNYDGDLTDKVNITRKDNEIVYKVKDSSSNSFKIIRKINVGDSEKPSITLDGDSYINLYVSDSYQEPGYHALDNCDGDITSLVEVSGSVNTSSVGVYTISYKVSDSSGNEEVVTRTVKVSEKSLIRPQGGGSGKGIIYLTFDDGPNAGTTNVILDVLKQEGVSATFFVTCNGPDYLIKRMYDEGHTVALHTASHNYKYVYASEANYFADLERVNNRVKSITGQGSMIVRFPGGSSNTISRFNPGIMSRLTKELLNRGYHYFDWNVDSNDAGGANSSSAVYRNVVNNISLNRENVVLMHDVKYATRDAIRDIIRYGKQNGYTFRKITDDTAMVTHRVNN